MQRGRARERESERKPVNQPEGKREEIIWNGAIPPETAFYG
jgi:hypothetical protein